MSPRHSIRHGTFALVCCSFIVSIGCGSDVKSYPIQKGKLICTPNYEANAPAVASYLAKLGFFKDAPGVASLKVLEGRTTLVLWHNMMPATLTNGNECRKIGVEIAKLFQPLEPVDILVLNDAGTQCLHVPYEPFKPEMPVTLSTRASIGGSSIVLQTKNTGDRHLQVQVSMTNPTTKATTNFTLELPPGRVVEHGWAEGWSFHAGDQILMRHHDYETVAITIN